VGKLYLALAPDRIEAPAGSLERFTPRTLRSARALSDAVAAARARGWAENRDEWIDGLSVVAAPIVARGTLRGALAVAAATPRMVELGREAARRTVAAAGEIGARLAGRAEEDFA
jgi:DNA-binding IclR family transcriptional regulator